MSIGPALAADELHGHQAIGVWIEHGLLPVDGALAIHETNSVPAGYIDRVLVDGDAGKRSRAAERTFRRALPARLPFWPGPGTA
jgi:hypothetical protein